MIANEYFDALRLIVFSSNQLRLEKDIGIRNLIAKLHEILSEEREVRNSCIKKVQA
jgi:hypothetical protein